MAGHTLLAIVTSIAYQLIALVTMKRGADHGDEIEASKRLKRQAVSHEDQFRGGLFDKYVLEEYSKCYAASEP